MPTEFYSGSLKEPIGRPRCW